MTNSKSGSELTLYDLPSRGTCACWSLNPWKTRLALNFKGVDYKTQWVEYPEIEPLFKSLNVPPNSTSPPYTIPGLGLPTGEVLQDSRAIASKLEELYPSPSFKLDSPKLPEVQTAVLDAFTPLRPLILPLVPTNLLSVVSAEYFESTRASRMGITLSELAATQGGEKAWQAAKEPLKNLVASIKGPYVLGEEVSYADFIIVGFLHFVRRAGGEEIWERLIGGDWDGERKLEAIYGKCELWLARDSH